MALAIVSLPACSKKAPSRAEQVANITNEAWALFAQSEYTAALAKFDEALELLSEYADAHAGRGWSLAFLGQFEEARFAFVMSRDFRNSVADTWAGGAFVYSVLDETDRVIEWAETTLAMTNGNWTFSRRPAITHMHLRLVLATAYWTRGSYVQCKGTLDVLEPTVSHSFNPTDQLADLTRLQETFRLF